MNDKIYLGTIDGIGKTYLWKHSWDCGWYWGFGYVGNSHNHFHIRDLIEPPKQYDPDWVNVLSQFTTSWLSQEQWWILRDLFIQAYALQKAAEVYHLGGHQTPSATPYQVLNTDMVNAINKDLETLLDTIWTLLHQWKGEKLT